MRFISVLFKKHKKFLPTWLQGTFIGEFCRYGFMIFLSAWVLQGVHITNWREVVIRYGIDVLITMTLVSFGVHWLIAFLIAHSLNFALNGQLFAMFTHMGATKVTADRILHCTCKMHDMIAQQEFIDASIAYGSLSRGCYKRTSDIDIRLIPAEKGWWRTAFYAIWLRTWAFFSGYPLDMYCYEPNVVVTKMRSDELPIMVNERDKCMESWYPKRVEWDDFVKIFTENNIKN